MPKLLTAEEVRVMLRFERIKTVYEYIEAGKIEAYKIGGEYRIEEESVFLFIKSQKV